MRPAARHDWIEQHLRSNAMLARGGVDILNAEFVDAYIDATGATHSHQPYGAARCPQLGRDLSEMSRQYRLRRQLEPLPADMRGMGFPLFVWHYTLAVRS